ncbi:MAG: Kdo2-lipid lauroyltransferase/acyltransferase [Pseudomonadota bacterium]|nr:Kdo2-lipid lauroyltransferase/acyltransferase [Pseudomonadota bacterium]
MIDEKLEQQIFSRPLTRWGKMMSWIFPYRKKVILENIHQVYAHRISQKAKIHLLQAFYSHFIKIISETFRLRFLSEKELEDQVRVEGYQHLLDVAEQGKGVLVLTGHFGNWEFAPLGGISQFKQFRGHFHFIRRSIGLKSLENILFKRYFQAGLRIINKKHALDKIFSALEQNHAVIFVLDQHASLANKDGLAVEFFGKKAGTYRSLAMVSYYADVPVVPAASYRTADNKHVLKFYPPMHWVSNPDPEIALYENTLLYNQMLEKIILEHPEQWWWLHNRWKLKEA